MSAIPPIEPAKPMHRPLLVRERQQEEQGGGRQAPKRENDEQEPDDSSDDGLPHVDLRV